MTELLKKINKTDIRAIIALISVLGCFTLMGMMQLRPIPHENKDVLNIAMGFLFGGLLSGVAGYYFGNSKTDKKEDS